jgi:4-amino-4-deoxy-L-arabinose transferase-like glycosyltransferase
LLQPFNARLIISWILLLFLVKFYLAKLLGLFPDEAFYWQSSQQLALAYADHPFMTALLVRIGTELLGDSTTGVRLMFLFMGCAFPYGIYLLARAHYGHQQSLVAAAFSLLMPFTATLGLIALPDVPLLFFAVFGLVAIERATRTNKLSAWVTTGVIAAMGLSTHYRFLLFPAAAFIYFVITPNGRSLWSKSGFWLAILIMLCGLLPVLIFNLDNQFEALNYQFSERQAWVFQSKGLRHSLEQMMVVTPLLYIALISALIMGLKKALKGDDRAALLTIFGGFPLAIYLFLAPFSDRSHLFFHWPSLGYIPLFVLLPEVIQSLQNRLSPLKFKLLFFLTTSMAALGSLALLLLVGLSVSDSLIKLSPPGSIAYTLAGWNSLQQKTEQLLAQQPNKTLLVIDRYFVDANIDFLNHGERPIYLLDHPKNNDHGRAFQYRLWDRDQQSIETKKGERAIIMIQESDTALSYKFGQTKQLCHIFDQLTWLDRVNLYGREKRYQFFSGIIDPDSERGSCSSLPSIGHLGKPRIIKGEEHTYKVDGWAFNDATGVSLVEIFIDGTPIKTARYGSIQLAAQKRFPTSSDQNHPNVGFSAQLKLDHLSSGKHEISAKVTSYGGNITILRPRYFNGPN